MDKSIYQVVPDIEHLLTRQDGWLDDQIAGELGLQVASRLKKQFEPRTAAPKLRLSSLGPRCPRALWASIHCPEEAESLPPFAVNKYSFGHIVEAWTIAQIKATGHLVTGEQDALVVDGIVGHRDCVVDGCIVDIKSCSSQSYEKFKNGTLAQADDFGYLDQLDAYVVGSDGDPLVETRDRAFILAVDKTLGKVVLYEHRVREEHIKERIQRYKQIVALTEPPHCECRSVADGESGNLKLDTRASYSAYKYFCNPNIRIFLYTGGPRYLTQVVRKPYDVRLKRYIPEVDRFGNFVN